MRSNTGEPDSSTRACNHHAARVKRARVPPQRGSFVLASFCCASTAVVVPNACASPIARYIPGVTPRAAGGEDLMLDELERLGLHCEPSMQLVVVCEVCLAVR